MGMIVIVGQFDIHPEDVSAAAELMRVMMEATIHEKGCRHYAYSRDLSNENRFQLSELWESDSELMTHFSTSHMATYRAGLALLRVQRRSVTRYEVTDATAL